MIEKLLFRLFGVIPKNKLRSEFIKDDYKPKSLLSFTIRELSRKHY